MTQSPDLCGEGRAFCDELLNGCGEDNDCGYRDGSADQLLLTPCRFSPCHSASAALSDEGWGAELDCVFACSHLGLLTCRLTASADIANLISAVLNSYHTVAGASNSWKGVQCSYIMMRHVL